MFDPSAPHIIVLLIVVLLLFGSRRLPGAAKSLGESMHIFKKSVHGLDADGKPFPESTPTEQTAMPPTAQLPVVAPQPLSAPPPSYDAVAQQQQMADLQRQIADLQREKDGVTANGAPLSEAQSNQQPS